MSSPDNALQAGIFSRLSSYSGLTSIIGGNHVYDFVPETAEPPYVVIGDDTLTEWDTKSRNGWDATVTIHAWSYETAGRKQVKSILSAIHDALHRQEPAVTVSGFTLVELRRDFQQTFQETAVEGQSDRYWHGLIRFRALIHA